MTRVRTFSVVRNEGGQTLTRRRRVKGLAALCVALVVASATTACVAVPLRVKTRVEDPSGVERALPKAAVAPGATTRAEIEARYKSFAVDAGVQNLFWGRFRQSSWAVGWAFFNPLDVYDDMISSGLTRTWGVYNLLVTFDPSGIVRGSALVPEEELHARLARATTEAGAPPLDLSQPLLVENLVPDRSDRIRAIEVQLNGTALAVMKYPPWKSRETPAPLPVSALVPVDQIDRLVVGGRGTDEPGSVKVEIRFNGRTDVGRSVTFSAEPRWAAVIVRWWAQVKSN